MSSARKVKIKLKIKAAKPRNPLVVHAAQRKAGSHRKSEASLRKKEKLALKKQLLQI
ncbi:hypothetical protein [Polaromonas sp. A23]|uniref:hypothetical protein n=1 Tax=Polaromonas sp. A23 TaxID=1944133 RepID=UPI001439719D|nr:hypothetical protein [Polaromonas sp. A23]